MGAGGAPASRQNAKKHYSQIVRIIPTINSLYYFLTIIGNLFSNNTYARWSKLKDSGVSSRQQRSQGVRGSKSPEMYSIRAVFFQESGFIGVMLRNSYNLKTRNTFLNTSKVATPILLNQTTKTHDLIKHFDTIYSILTKIEIIVFSVQRVTDHRIINIIIINNLCFIPEKCFLRVFLLSIL